MKNFLRFLLIPAIMFVGAVQAMACEDGCYKSVNLNELQSMIKEQKDLMLIDARGEKYIEDNEGIAGAKLLPADKTTAESLAALAPAKETPLVFYCSDTKCGASAAAAHIAHEAGYKHVYKYPGGFAEWKEKGLPTAKLN